MISSRPYRRGLSIDDATRRLRASAGTQFDPVVTDAFVQLASVEAAHVFEATGITMDAAL